MSDVKDQENNSAVFEYEGKIYLEDESIVGNPDTMSFITKELLASLNSGDTKFINPFIVGKLDLETIKFYRFPTSKSIKGKQIIGRKLNEDGSAPTEENPLSTRNIARMIAHQEENDIKQNEKEINADYFQVESQNSRRVNSPKGLFIYCNLMEILRLRNVLLRLMAETKELELVYHKQRKRIGRESYKLRFADQISFDNMSIHPDKLNFIDEGPMTGVESYLAVSEFDKSLLSWINFRDKLCFQTMLTSAGLEELRAIVHYQIMHLQVLIVGVRINQELLDPSLKALTELQMLKENCLLPNSSFNVEAILTKFGEGFNQYAYDKEKIKHNTRVNSFVASAFYQVWERKTNYRSAMSKKCGSYATKISNTYAKPEWELRLIRTFRIKLLHGYCFNILREAYHDSLKIHLLQVCSKLKQDFVLLPPQYSISEMFEEDLDDFDPKLSFNKKTNYKKKETSGFVPIPSPEDIMVMESYTIDEMDEMMREFNGLNIDMSKAYQQELDSVVHPSTEYSASNDHHQPHFTQAEDLESSIRELFRPYKPKGFAGRDKDDNTREDNLTLYQKTSATDFKGSQKFNTELYKKLCYYSLLYRIYKLEYFAAKSPSNVSDVLELEICVYSGADYWDRLEKEKQDEEEEFMNYEIYSDSEDERMKDNNVSKQILKDIVNKRRRRHKLQDSLENCSEAMIVLSRTLKGLEDQSFDNILEYVVYHYENRFYSIIYSINKCLENIYTAEILQSEEDSVIRQIVSLQTLNKKLTHRERKYVPWFNYRYFSNYSDYYAMTTKSINDNAMEPEEIKLLEGLYPNLKFSDNVYAGQNSNNALECLDVEILDVTQSNKAIILKSFNSVKGMIQDYLEIFKLSNLKGWANIKERNDVLQSFVMKQQLQYVLFSWYSMSEYPLSPRQYDLCLKKFKEDLFKRIYAQNKVGIKHIESIIGHIKLDTTNEDEMGVLAPHELEQLKMKRKKEMAKYTLVELINQTRSEVIVIRDEIDKIILERAIEILHIEHSALSAALNTGTSDISALIHPFQQFASVCFPTVDRYSHLDMVNKVSAVQKCLIRLKNRCTEVETLTSGPGIVFTIKDFNECIQMLCRDLIKYGELELRSRSETAVLKENHLLHLLYMKDQKISNLEGRIENAKTNMDKLISAYLYEHGNKIIYELDIAKRQLRTFKDNIYDMEEDLRNKIKTEYQNTIRKNVIMIEASQRSFKDFKDGISTKIKADILQEQQVIEKTIKQKAFEYKKIRPIEPEENAKKEKEGYDPEKYWEVIDNAKKAQSDAIKELSDLSEQMRKNEDDLKMQNVHIREKMEEKIVTLKKELSENKTLWQRLAEAEKRENILKQELVFTQQ